MATRSLQLEADLLVDVAGPEVEVKDLELDAVQSPIVDGMLDAETRVLTRFRPHGRLDVVATLLSARTRPGPDSPLGVQTPSDVEAELHDVVVVHDVVLALHPHLAAGFRGGYGATDCPAHDRSHDQ